MSIKLKLVIGFLLIVGLHLGIESWNLIEMKAAFQNEIGHNSTTLATEIMDKIDRDLFRKIEIVKEYVETEFDLQRLLQESNDHFAGLGSEAEIQAYIDAKDKEWMETDAIDQTPFMQMLMGNSVSLKLQKIMSYYNQEYNYTVFGEIFMTNQYGANVAQTGKTSDYRQDDEEWWQQGKDEGIWVGDLEYDKSAAIDSLAIIAKIEDDEGRFIGILKAVLNIQEVYQILDHLKNESKYQSYQVQLIDKEGKVLYPQERLNDFSKDISKNSINLKTDAGENGFFVEKSEKGVEMLKAYSSSKGYKNFKGLGWSILLSMNTDEIFQPVDTLERELTIFFLMAALISITIGLFISLSILRPILSLVRVTRQISQKSDYSIRVPKTSNDEISILIDGFNKMLMKIQERDEAMTQSESRLRQLIDLIPHPINAKDITGKFLLANRAQAEYFGTTVDHLLGKNLQSFLGMHQDLMARALEDDREVIESGKTKIIPEVSIELYGKKRVFQAQKIPFNIAGIKTCLRVSVDITDLKTAQNEIQELNKGLEQRVKDQTRELRATLLQLEKQHHKLQESESRLRQVIDLIPHPIYAKDKTGKFHLANRAQAELYDVTVDQLVDAHQRDILIHKEKLESIQQEDTEVIERGKEIMVPETSFVDNKGKSHIYQVHKSSFNIAGIETALGVSVDITELKKTQNELQQVKNYLNNIINSMPSILVGVDLDGQVTQWNQEAEKRTGVRAELAQGKMLKDVFPQLVGLIEKIQEAIHNRQPLKDEKVVYEDQKKKQISDITVYPLVADGQEHLPVEGAVIRIDDVTERTRLEEMIVQTEKMMSVGGLAAGMAHEINNPLSGIIQGIQVIQNRFSLELGKNQQVAQECGIDLTKVQAYMEKRQILEFMKDIRESGNRAANIVSNMLQFSRGSTASKEAIFLSELINRVVELASSDYDLKKHYDFRQIEIIREFDPDCPAVFCTDIEIEQVLLNLLKNAGQAVKERKDKDPSWNKPQIILRFQQENDQVRIEVEDNGPGIEEADRKRIFEPFFTTKDVGVGTGLGLSVSYFIITENHRGTMVVESTLGRGTKFIIHLPL